jgi:hypothetical protein
LTTYRCEATGSPASRVRAGVVTSHNSIRTVGNFVKWLIVGILGLAPGTVVFGESAAKILATSKVSDHNHKQPP